MSPQIEHWATDFNRKNPWEWCKYVKSCCIWYPLKFLSIVWLNLSPRSFTRPVSPSMLCSCFSYGLHCFFGGDSVFCSAWTLAVRSSTLALNGVSCAAAISLVPKAWLTDLKNPYGCSKSPSILFLTLQHRINAPWASQSIENPSFWLYMFNLKINILKMESNIDPQNLGFSMDREPHSTSKILLGLMIKINRQSEVWIDFSMDREPHSPSNTFNHIWNKYPMHRFLGTGLGSQESHRNECWTVCGAPRCIDPSRLQPLHSPGASSFWGGQFPNYPKCIENIGWSFLGASKMSHVSGQSPNHPKCIETLNWLIFLGASKMYPVN